MLDPLLIMQLLPFLESSRHNVCSSAVYMHVLVGIAGAAVSICPVVVFTRRTGADRLGTGNLAPSRADLRWRAAGSEVGCCDATRRDGTRRQCQCQAELARIGSVR